MHFPENRTGRACLPPATPKALRELAERNLTAAPDAEPVFNQGIPGRFKADAGFRRDKSLGDFIFVRIHAMPCVNRCWHCFCEGSPHGRYMETGKSLLVLNQLSDLKTELGTVVFPMFFDEPTLHPSFKQIMKHQLKKGLIYDQWWFSTNGYGLARMSEEDWKELADAGFDYIRLTFHGIGETHDELVGRKGAYGDLVETIRKAEKHGINWLAGMVLNASNQSMYEETEAAVTELGTPCAEFGWMLPMARGRAVQTGNRVRIGQVSRLLAGKSGWYAEGDFVGKVLSDPELGRRSIRDNRCGIVYLDVDEDLNVFYGGGCDHSPFHFVKEMVFLGNLLDSSALSCYRRYFDNPPEPVTLLEKATWAELATKYGNRRNDEVYHCTDLIGKWGEAHLREHFDKVKSDEPELESLPRNPW